MDGAACRGRNQVQCELGCETSFEEEGQEGLEVCGHIIS